MGNEAIVVSTDVDKEWSKECIVQIEVNGWDNNGWIDVVCPLARQEVEKLIKDLQKALSRGEEV